MLSISLAGKLGLDTFGYTTTYDEINFRYLKSVAELDNSCRLTPAECDLEEEKIEENENEMIVASEWAIPGVCIAFSGLDYKISEVFDVLSSFQIDSDLQGCCRHCKATSDCKHFTVDPLSGICYLKTSKGEMVKNKSTHWLISGDLL